MRTRMVRPDDEANKYRELARDILSEEERKTFALQKSNPAGITSSMHLLQ